MFETIAIHDVRPEHQGEFLGFMRKVEQAVAGADGLISFGSYREAGGRLVGVGHWESESAFIAAMPRIVGLADQRRPEWTASEDQLLALTPA